MADLHFTPEASADLSDIYDFSVERFGIEMADSYHDGLEAACERLVRFPKLGPIFPGILPSVRCLTFRNHHIFYDIEGDAIFIVRILHHAMDARRRLE